MPKKGLDEPIHFVDRMGTGAYWAARKEYIHKEVFTSMNELISLSRNEDRSLGTLKPYKIVDFIVEETEREWKPRWQENLSNYECSILVTMEKPGQGG